MNLEKARFYEYIVRDDHLVSMLEKHEDELRYAAKRVKKHRELRDTIAEILQMELETLDDAERQLELLMALEQERANLVTQTRFLLYADYIDDPDAVEKIYFPEDV